MTANRETGVEPCLPFTCVLYSQVSYRVNLFTSSLPVGVIRWVNV